MKTFKKLIETALPLDAINAASAREKSIRHGHPSTLHLWWARRPLAAARAVLFAQMVDDPSAHPERFPTEAAVVAERERLFEIIRDLVLWENTTNEAVLQRARNEIRRSWADTCAANAGHPRAAELFNPDRLPAFHDPFAGGGAIPLEAQRLGLEAYASDLNPVAVLINKAMIEIPPKFAGWPPVNPAVRQQPGLFTRTWKGAEGLAEDVRYYGKWMRDEAERRIGHLYPKIKVTAEMAAERPDLKPYAGRELTVIAWLWARTVPSPNPAFAHVDVPLASTFMLSTKPGKEAYVQPVIDGDSYRFTVRVGQPQDPEAAKSGTKLGGSGSSFFCLVSKSPMTFEYLRAEAKAGRMGARLMAVVAEGDRGRVYLSPTPEMEAIALSARPQDVPDADLPAKALGFRIQEYGMTKWRELFTPRQLVALTTFSDLVLEARQRARADAAAAGLRDDGRGLDDGGTGAAAYADAVAIYLSFAISKVADRGSSLTRWMPTRDSMYNTFSRQALPMSWDYVEVNSIGQQTGGFAESSRWTIEAIEGTAATQTGYAYQLNVVDLPQNRKVIFSTDPPYYDNIGYADLSDFFYVWLRRSLRMAFPALFATLSVPKADELVATPYRHGSKEKAEAFFLNGMTKAMTRLARQTHPSFPITIYYAFKQAETESGGTSSTGWETFLDAVLNAGLAISGTWPMRTELGNRLIGKDTNALASSIILVCRPRPAEAPTATRREFLTALKAELPRAVADLQRGNVAPVDLAQAAIGPGMAVYTRYGRVLDAAGRPLTVRDALALINATLDEALAEQEGDFDADTRWALAWFEQSGFAEGEYGVAETLSKAKNTSVGGLVEAGILASKGGKVRLLRPAELKPEWNPNEDKRATVWEMVHYLSRALETSEAAAGELAALIGGRAETARELAYRLYTLCERKKRAEDALRYNALVQSWPEIMRLARQTPVGQGRLFGE